VTTLLLTIIGPEHSVDVAVPGDLPLSKLITPLLETEFVDLVGSPPRAWVLALPDGEPLEPERSLIECGVADGHVLRLRPASDRASEALAGTRSEHRHALRGRCGRSPQRECAAPRRGVRHDRCRRCPRRGRRPRPIAPEAAAIGEISAWPTTDTPADERVRALIMAADHQRLDVVDQLLSTGISVDAVDPQWGRQALRVAAEHGRPRSVRHLLARSADPALKDEHRRTALDFTGPDLAYMRSPAHDEVAAILAPLTRGA
jgi:hypothetical protein